MYMKIEKCEVMHVVKNYSFAHFSGKETPFWIKDYDLRDLKKKGEMSSS
jgi:hypothetical protein